MKTTMAWISCSLALSACVPGSKDAGVLDTGTGGGATDASTAGDASSTGGSVNDTSAPFSDTVEETTGGVSARCPGIEPDTTLEVATFDESVETFESQRDAAGGTYWYRVQRGFDEWGSTPNCLYETLVVVEAGAVIRREFALIDEWPDASGYPPCEQVDEVEVGAEVGASDFRHAATPWTLDMLYAACCDEILSAEPADEYYFGFYTFEDGLMRGCGRSSVNCADNCGESPEDYNGEIRLAEIGFGPPPG